MDCHVSGCLPDHIAHVIARARRRRGTRRHVADQIGIDSTYLLRIERGERRPSVATTERLISGLGLDRGTASELLALAVRPVDRALTPAQLAGLGRFGERLKELQATADILGVELCLGSGVSSTTISRYRNASGQRLIYKEILRAIVTTIVALEPTAGSADDLEQLLLRAAGPAVTDCWPRRPRRGDLEGARRRRLGRRLVQAGRAGDTDVVTELSREVFEGGPGFGEVLADAFTPAAENRSFSDASDDEPMDDRPGISPL